MSLIKRTIVLTKGSCKGYVTVVRIGSAVGAKLVLTEPADTPLWLVIKVASEPEFIARVNGERSEYDMDVALMSRDPVGAMLVDDAVKVYCAGGRRELINMKNVKEYIDKELAGDTQETVEKAVENDIAVIQSAQTSETSAIKQEEETRLSDNTEETQTEVVADEETVEEAVEVAEEITAEPAVQSAIQDEADTEISEIERAESAETAADIEEIPVTAAKGEPEITDLRTGAKTAFGFPSSPNFYAGARAQIEEMFTVYPRDTLLASLVPDSEWVRVNYDGDEFYVVGLLRDEGQVTHIAYGVPGEKSVRPPKEAAELCDFLPLPNEDGKGYWLMFQNPEDGAIFKNGD